MSRPNDKGKIVEHYDTVSPYYLKLWGEHLHHGYWIRGDESKEQAQLQLIERLAGLAKIPPGAEILDIGCGFGGSSLYLARTFQASVTGINLSPAQVEIANQKAREQGANARFVLMDAEAMNFPGQFDVLWSVESISHYYDVAGFFTSAARYLKPGGTFALTDFFKKKELSPAENKKYIEPIEKGMFAALHTLDGYEGYLSSAGLQVEHREVLNEHTARTWDVCLDIIKDKALWDLAFKLGPDFVTYLKGFQAMRAGYSSGTFEYGLLVARKSGGP